MFLLKLKFALRSLWRATAFTYTNLIGLAVSIGAILCIYMYVGTEWDTDSQFQDRENIYRIIRTVEGPTSSYQTPTLAAPFKEQIAFDLTLEQSDVLRVLQEDELVSYENSVFFEPNFLYADENFFQILDFPFHLGNPDKALGELNSVVLSRQLARKYFGDQNPLGKILEIDGKGSLEVTGVLVTPSRKSHLSIDFVANLGSIGYTGRILQDRESHVMNYYLRISPQKLDFATTTLSSFGDKHLNEAGNPNTSNLSLQQLPQIYFSPALESDIARHGNKALIQSLLVIACILSLLTIANFVNLMIAKLTRRVRQIGVKKVLGSTKQSLVMDWALEVYVIVLAATLLGAIASSLLLPTLLQTYGLTLIVPDTLQLVIAGLVFTLLLTGLIILIPGWVFSSLSSFSALSNKMGSIKTHLVQYFLLSFQFVIAFVLIVVTVVINRQYQYMQEKDRGLNDEQVLVFSSNNKHSWKNRDFIKQSVEQLSGVKEVSMTYGGLPTSSTEISSFLINQSVYQWNTAFIQPNLINLLDVKVLDGKAFDAEIDSEVKGSVLLNATAAKALGWPQKDLIGTSIILNEDNTSKQVLGIIQDYHYESIKKEIAPLVLQSTDWEETFVVKLAGKATPSLLAEIEGIWQQYVPKHPFAYQFLDETYQGLHRDDTKQGKIIFFFTLLTIIIASIGTLSLSSFIQQSRVKEIAIKKILGAPMLNIFYGLSATLLRVLVFACLLAIPLAWVLSAEWLSAYRYRISLSPDIFLVGITGLVVLILGLIITQSWKTAMANPVDSLKVE